MTKLHVTAQYILGFVDSEGMNLQEGDQRATNFRQSKKLLSELAMNWPVTLWLEYFNIQEYFSCGRNISIFIERVMFTNM